MPSKMRNRLLISLVVISLIVISFHASYAETTTYVYDELNRLIQVIYEDGSVVNYTYDASGNRITLIQTSGDTTPPTGTITINSGALVTNNPEVILTLTCSDNVGCSQMQFSNDNVTYSAPETYSGTKTWTLNSGDGTKTVYAKFKDMGGNWSTAYSDTIDLTMASYITSLLHMNGTDQSTTFIDDAPGGGRIWTAYGNAKLTTADKKFGSASGTFDGSGDYISTPYSSDFNFGSGDFTIDFWFKRSGGIGTNQYLGLYSSAGAGIGYFMIQVWTDNKFYLTFWDTLNASHQLAGTTAITDTNTWHHLAFVRSGATITEYIDGIACGTHNIGSLAIYNNTQWGLAWGRLGAYDGQYFNGKLDEVRISKGLARWTSNFTPPSSEYIVDTTPPTTTASPTGGTYNSAQSVTLTCSDGTGFGCNKTYYTTDGSTPTTSSLVYSSPINISIATTLKFFSTDLASNSESVKTQVYTIDTTPPTGTITINSGAASTDNRNVTLTLSCSDANGCSQMKFSNDIDSDPNYSTPETYSETKAWTLTTGDGTKTVYAKFKDTAGNWSAAYSDTIEYSGGWLSGWSYRKLVTISRASGAVSNYQMKLLVGESAGASGENVDCNGHIQADFNDLRFTTSDGTTLLSYWIESITGTTPNRLATVWIKFDSIGTTATTFYMYYGKSDAAAGSNFDGTFIFGDPWDNATLNTTRWPTSLGAPTYSINTTSHYLEVTNMGTKTWADTTHGFLGKAITLPDGWKIEPAYGTGGVRGYLADTSGALIYSALRLEKSDNSQIARFMMQDYLGSYNQYYHDVVAGASSWSENSIYEPSSRYVKIRKESGGIKIDNSSDDITFTNRVDVANSDTVDHFRINISAYPGYPVTLFRLYSFKVRHYLNPEPAWGSWGNEEVYQ